MSIADRLALFILIFGLGTIITNLLILWIAIKLYTEVFKDQSIKRRHRTHDES